MELIIDIGNTAAKLVLFDKGEPIRCVRSSLAMLEDTLRDVADQAPQRCIVGTVVPLSQEQRNMLDNQPFPVIYAEGELLAPYQERLDYPTGLGTDRIAAVVAAIAQYPATDMLIIDAGTCVTYELILGGKYTGGTIAPGVRLRLQAMHEHTALLPLVNQQGECPEIGHDTETALRCGALRGLHYEIEGYIRHFREKYPSLLVFLTGGDGIRFESSIKSGIFVDEFLVPRGLNHILTHE